MSELLAHAVNTYGSFYKTIVFAVPADPDPNAGMFTLLQKYLPQIEKRC